MANSPIKTFGFESNGSHPAIAYRCSHDLNLYDAPDCRVLATQMAADRYLFRLDECLALNLIDASFQDRPRDLGSLFSKAAPAGKTAQAGGTETIAKALTETVTEAIAVQCWEDDYPGWLHPQDLAHLQPVTELPIAPSLDAVAISQRLDQVIAFTLRAMTTYTCYLWGGTIAPDYDCSGLMQAAFRAAGIWLPRDAYQQEGFLEPVTWQNLRPGDLVFFGTPHKATHVGLYLGDGRYIHSSGQDLGRNGIAIDRLSESGDRVSQNYFKLLRGFGRVTYSYRPVGLQMIQIPQNDRTGLTFG